MLMRKIKFKILILLIFVLSMNKYSLDIFADTPSPDAPNTKPIKNNSTVLDGEIGEWNPTLDDKLDFSKNEVDGHIPNIDEYYTISVTVPLNMEFMVLPNSTRPFGSFFSPIYNIKNNGSKTIAVRIKSFDRVNDTNDSDTSPLYIERLKHGDGKTQMELKLGSMDKLSSIKFNKEVDLTQISNLSDSERELCQLKANESKIIKFASSKWEMPNIESNQDKATYNFRAIFEFSIQ